MRPTRNWRHTWCFLCFATEAVYQGVTNVRFDDSEDSYGMIGGTISWTLPENMENVELFMPWLGVDDTAEFQKRATGMSLFNVNNNIYAYAPETEFVARPTNRVPPWPAFFPYNGDEPLLSIQVHTRISGNWQTTEELEEVSKMVIHDLGWTGTSLPITKEDVIFTDQDLRCGFLGGSILISVPSGTDMAMVQSWRVYLSEDLQGNNPSAVSWDLPVSFNAMVTLPADFQQNQSTVLNVAGLTDNGELTLRKPILDDCGGLPDLPFNMSFTDQDPEAEMINGTVSVEIALEYSDQYSSLNFFLALNSTGYGRLYLGQLEPFQTQLQVLTGTRLDSRDHLLAYLNNSYGEQLFPRFLRIQDLSNAAPGASSKVRSMSFTDENQFYGEIAGMVRWVPGSVTVARYFAIYVAQNSSGKNQVQVSPEVPVDQGDEWYINVRSTQR
ncbi:unnamed protein product [Durusdinium trenchii]|uniref:Uncharacterized protein n=2 Tax=Durusdinium trenchii TaxID=1381693 RepID=A0ABP0LER4_9DINO